jgi:hypothetical protein
MNNKTTLQNNNTIIDNHNNELRDILNAIAALPEADNREISAVEDTFITHTVGGDYTNDRVATIKYGTFYEDTGLTSVSFPNVTRVDSYAFYKCTSLENIDMPKLQSASQYAFSYTQPSSINYSLLEAASSYTFSHITNQCTVVLPKLDTVPNSCFRDSKGITSIDLAIATKIDTLAFYFCNSLETLILRNPDVVCTLTNTGAFSGTKIAGGTGYIYVPDELVEEYRIATNWSSFTNQIRGLSDLDNVLDLSDYSFPITLDEGLEISYNKADMSITFNGTLTDDGGFNIPITQDLIGTYTLSYTPAESDKAFYISIDNKTETMVNGWGATEKTFTLTEQPSQLMFWFDHSSTPERNVYDNYTIKLKLVKQEGGNE